MVTRFAFPRLPSQLLYFPNILPVLPLTGLSLTLLTSPRLSSMSHLLLSFPCFHPSSIKLVFPLTGFPLPLITTPHLPRIRLLSLTHPRLPLPLLTPTKPSFPTLIHPILNLPPSQDFSSQHDQSSPLLQHRTPASSDCNRDRYSPSLAPSAVSMARYSGVKDLKPLES